MKIIFFDGYGNLCNGLVDWLLRKDHKRHLKFASLQGQTARQMLDVTKFSMARLLDMVAYLREGKRFEKSSAVLMVLSDLGCFWKLVKLFIVVPAFVRYLKIGHPQEGQLQHRKPPPPRTTQRKKPRNTKVTGLD